MDNRFKIGDTFDIIVTRAETNFDKACDSARKIGLGKISMDENGHAHGVKDWDRYASSLSIHFLTYTSISFDSHVYKFTGTIEQDPDY